MQTRDRAWRLSAAAAFLLAATVFPAAAADKPCSKSDAALAEKAIDAVTTWAALQRVVRDYRHCDTGQAASLFSESLMRVLIDGWPKLADGEAIMAKDPEFRDWVGLRLSHPSIAKEDARSLRDLAKGSCPKPRAATCDFLLESLSAGQPMTMPKLMDVPAAPSPPAAK
jgi:hypothetical protein